MEENAVQLNKDQKRRISAMLCVGCERATAARAVGLTPRDVQAEVERDPEFAKELLRSEGTAELHRMKTVHNAASDEKYWRAATWWIEQKAKKRLARRKGKQVTAVETHDFLSELEDIVFAEMHRDDERDRLLIRLYELAHREDATLEATEEPRQE
jgi:hypothetical protein